MRSSNPKENPILTRREFLKDLWFAAASAFILAACGGSSSTDSPVAAPTLPALQPDAEPVVPEEPSPPSDEHDSSIPDEEEEVSDSPVYSMGSLYIDLFSPEPPNLTVIGLSEGPDNFIEDWLSYIDESTHFQIKEYIAESFDKEGGHISVLPQLLNQVLQKTHTSGGKILKLFNRDQIVAEEIRNITIPTIFACNFTSQDLYFLTRNESGELYAIILDYKSFERQMLSPSNVPDFEIFAQEVTHQAQKRENPEKGIGALTIPPDKRNQFLEKFEGDSESIAEEIFKEILPEEKTPEIAEVAQQLIPGYSEDSLVMIDQVRTDRNYNFTDPNPIIQIPVGEIVDVHKIRVAINPLTNLPEYFVLVSRRDLGINISGRLELTSITDNIATSGSQKFWILLKSVFTPKRKI